MKTTFLMFGLKGNALKWNKDTCLNLNNLDVSRNLTISTTLLMTCFLGIWTGGHFILKENDFYSVVFKSDVVNSK